MVICRIKPGMNYETSFTAGVWNNAKKIVDDVREFVILAEYIFIFHWFTLKYSFSWLHT